MITRIISTISKEEALKLKELLEKDLTIPADFARKNLVIQKETRVEDKRICHYALDAGEKAFANLPCRGNKILCQHPDNKDFISYTKACNPGMCKYFKQKEL